jgi:hypothetical protein
LISNHFQILAENIFYLVKMYLKMNTGDNLENLSPNFRMI